MPAAERLGILIGYPIPDRRERRKRVGTVGRSLRRECRLRARSAHLVVDERITAHFSGSSNQEMCLDAESSYQSPTQGWNKGE